MPSSAAEFAQPDVLIGATILAYRYEGLRESDLKTTIRMLKENLHQESGPKSSGLHIEYLKIGSTRHARNRKKNEILWIWSYFSWQIQSN